MKLRYLIICDKNGRKTSPQLQCWNKDFEIWENVPEVCIKEKDIQDDEED